MNQPQLGEPLCLEFVHLLVEHAKSIFLAVLHEGDRCFAGVLFLHVPDTYGRIVEYSRSLERLALVSAIVSIMVMCDVIVIVIAIIEEDRNAPVAIEHENNRTEESTAIAVNVTYPYSRTRSADGAPREAGQYEERSFVPPCAESRILRLRCPSSRCPHKCACAPS